MLDFIHRYMPDWAIRILIGITIWFAICFFYITPFIYDRVTIQLRRDYVEQVSVVNKHWDNKNDTAKNIEYADCLYKVYFNNYEIEFAQWVATGTYYEPYSIKNMIELINEAKYKEICGAKPWKNKRV